MTRLLVQSSKQAIVVDGNWLRGTPTMISSRRLGQSSRAVKCRSEFGIALALFPAFQISSFLVKASDHLRPGGYCEPNTNTTEQCVP